MEDYLTTKQVQEFLKVDRITIYRMLDDGRLKGVKIGQQWRFSAGDVEKLLSGGCCETSRPAEPISASNFPTHCVQAIQDVFADIGEIAAVTVDPNGQPLTATSHASALYQMLQSTPEGYQDCTGAWKSAIERQDFNQFIACPGGLQCVIAPVRVDGQPVAYLVAGQFRIQPLTCDQEAALVNELAQTCSLDPAALHEATEQVQILNPARQAQVLSWPGKVAGTLESILAERTGLMNRLQQIAQLSAL